MKIKNKKKLKEYKEMSPNVPKWIFILKVGVPWFLGQNYKWRTLSKSSFLYIVVKVLKCGYWKWAHIFHLETKNLKNLKYKTSRKFESNDVWLECCMTLELFLQRLNFSFEGSLFKTNYARVLSPQSYKIRKKNKLGFLITISMQSPSLIIE
jgi:hypothetical protein